MKVVILVAIMILFGCAAATKQLNAQARDPDLLYRAKCTACHRLYPPQDYTYQKFQVYVTRYGSGLSDEERPRLLDYLAENAKQERE
ncbi:MAG: cytochrome c [Candidatus Omnitrophota bacterium]|nr:cytochrome c [Candidatus Omnitrophota bacterium]